MFVRRFLWLALTCLFIGHMPPGFRSTLVYSAQAKHRLPAKPRSTIKENTAPPIAPKYDCYGKPQQYSNVGRENIERAIDDALGILKKCEPCRRMFDSEDPNYAIELLSRLKRDKAIIVSTETPFKWLLSNDHKKLTVTKYKKLNPSAAETLDLAGSRSGEMIIPCIYINPTGYIVTGQLAENFALYGLDPPVQRAVAILHELGHVAGILQHDGGDSMERRNKSVANTNCIRWNCISCKVFQPCPDAPERPKRRRKSTVSNLYFNGVGLATMPHGSSFRRMNR